MADTSHTEQFIGAGAIAHPVAQTLVTRSRAPSQTVEDTAALDSSIGDLIAIISHIARGGVEHYSTILDAGIFTQLAPIISSPLPELRAKMCNLIGNLCKHGDAFYATLQTHQTLLPEVYSSILHYMCIVAYYVYIHSYIYTI